MTLIAIGVLYVPEVRCIYGCVDSDFGDTVLGQDQ